MSALGNFITTRIAAERAAGLKTTAMSMAARMGVKPPVLSRLINNPVPPLPNTRTINRIVSGISDDPAIQAECWIAFIRDTMGRSHHLVSIQPATGTRTQETPPDDSAYRQSGSDLSEVARQLGLNFLTVEAIRRIMHGCAMSARFNRSVRDLAEIAEHDILKK